VEPNNGVQRDLGEHGARLNALEGDVTEIRTDVKKILAHIEQHKGGWRVLLIMSGIAGGVGAFMGWLGSFIGWKA